MQVNQATNERRDANIGETLAQLDEGTRIEQATATVLRLFLLGIALYALLKMAEIFYGLSLPF